MNNRNTQRPSWEIYKGFGAPHSSLSELPEAPPWRIYNSNARLTPIGATFQPGKEMVRAVNAALYLRRPLLLTGKPGTGKSSLIRAVAHELQMGEVLQWSITSRSTLRDGLYQYDALGRLHQKQFDSDTTDDIGDFLQLGPLGTALLPNQTPRALLIDEIDKSDIDFPNDLLNIFEEGEFTIPELARYKESKVQVRQWKSSERDVLITKGRVQCSQFPFVVLTSNGERDFAPAFLRRCIRLSIPEPTKPELEKIVHAHFQKLDLDTTDLITKFYEERERSKGNLATDQLLNAIYLLMQPIDFSEDLVAKDNTQNESSKSVKDEIRDTIFKPLNSNA